MIAVDTNVVVRLIADDHPDQSQVVRSLLRSDRIWISKTVILETIWVLQKYYPFEAIPEMMDSLVGLENVLVEDASEVSAAFHLMEHGVDPADALHLASAPAGVRFVTFDRDLVRRAKRADAANVEAL
jgi:predicted nucleic acid-binding protein